MPGQDDWRVTFELRGPEQSRFLARLREARLASKLRRQLDSAAILTHGDGHLYIYVSSEIAARATEQLVCDALDEEGFEAETTIERWHPIEQQWEASDVPLPLTEEEASAEHARQQADESATAQALNHAEWEVLIELPTHAAAVETAQALRERGHRIIRRWSYLIAPAATEDEARDLSRELTEQLDADAAVSVRPSGSMLLEVLPSSPFLIFSGIRSHAGKER